ncbi:unnamed protein product [Amaranthus hypochondriacus]
MNCLAWNCKGLGNSYAIQALTGMVKKKTTTLFFLMETINKRGFIEWFRNSLGFAKSFVVEPDERSDGLAMLWKEEVNGSVGSYCQNHIDLMISTEGKVAWRLTGFYGLPKRARRRDSWELLKVV